MTKRIKLCKAKKRFKLKVLGPILLYDYQAPDQTTVQDPDQVPVQAPVQAPDQAPNQAPDQAQV